MCDFGLCHCTCRKGSSPTVSRLTTYTCGFWSAATIGAGAFITSMYANLASTACEPCNDAAKTTWGLVLGIGLMTVGAASTLGYGIKRCCSNSNRYKRFYGAEMGTVV
jgi:hypothetical protein